MQHNRTVVSRSWSSSKFLGSTRSSGVCSPANTCSAPSVEWAFFEVAPYVMFRLAGLWVCTRDSSTVPCCFVVAYVACGVWPTCAHADPCNSHIAWPLPKKSSCSNNMDDAWRMCISLAFPASVNCLFHRQIVPETAASYSTIFGMPSTLFCIQGLSIYFSQKSMLPGIKCLFEERWWAR